jgi:hypothetical protein
MMGRPNRTALPTRVAARAFGRPAPIQPTTRAVVIPTATMPKAKKMETRESGTLAASQNPPAVRARQLSRIATA